MSDLFRDAPVGQFVRWVTKGRLLKYQEELDEFQCPPSYTREQKPPVSSRTSSDASTIASSSEFREPKEEPLELSYSHHLSTIATAPDHEARNSFSSLESRLVSKITTRPRLENVLTRADLEQAYSNATRQETLKTQPTRPIEPSVTSDGTILVDWYTTDDQENPQNWSLAKKSVVVLVIYFYTLAVYIGSAIITPSQPYIEEKFHISPEVASLGLSIYVFGYGLGPLLFSPLSEIPVIGRSPPYVVTLTMFVLVSIPTALVNNFPALIVLRFLQGFFGSPILATGAATLGDVHSLIKLPYYLTGFAGFATIGPGVSPLISGFSVPATNWHWSLWEILWLAGPVYVAVLLLLPETSAANILLRRARRLRAKTGNNNLRSQSEIDQASLTVNEVIVSNLWRPLQINIQDPAVLFTSLYTALMYGIFYSFFEVFPMVYSVGISKPGSPTHGYGMNAGQLGLIFLSVSVGVTISIVMYISYLYFVFDPEIRTSGLGAPERRLIPGLYASFLVPIGLFIFAWTGFNSPKIHWIVPTIGIVIVTIGIFILFQCMFIYIPLTYPQYAASLFAGNDFARSSVAAGAIHFSRPLFLNLGVGPGVSLLAGLTVGGVLGIFALWYWGATLRARSRFAAK